MILTNEIIKKAESRSGGFTRKQLSAIGIDWPPQRGWKSKSIGNDYREDQIKRFIGIPVNKKKNKGEILNGMSKKDDWAWQPEKKDVPDIKIKTGKLSKNKGKKKKKRQKVSKQKDDYFYSSREWRELRVRVLERYDCKCMMCGRSPKANGIVIHVDHIKPRSKFPQLSLEFSNLQLLCHECNLGKGNKHETDWRPYSKEAEDDLDRMQLVEINIYT